MTRVLIVDDERNIRTTLRDILEDRGFEVSVAASGERAVSMCGSGVYDVVLMDVRMPGIDGLEALRRIRRQDAGARILMMSAYTLEHVESEAMETGALGFFRKPVDPDELIRAISGCVAGQGPRNGRRSASRG